MANEGQKSLFEAALFPEGLPEELVSALNPNYPEEYVLGSDWVSQDIFADLPVPHTATGDDLPPFNPSTSVNTMTSNNPNIAQQFPNISPNYDIDNNIIPEDNFITPHDNSNLQLDNQLRVQSHPYDYHQSSNPNGNIKGREPSSSSALLLTPRHSPAPAALDQQDQVNTHSPGSVSSSIGPTHGNVTGNHNFTSRPYASPELNKTPAYLPVGSDDSHGSRSPARSDGSHHHIAAANEDSHTYNLGQSVVEHVAPGLPMEDPTADIHEELDEPVVGDPNVAVAEEVETANEETINDGNWDDEASDEEGPANQDSPASIVATKQCEKKTEVNGNKVQCQNLVWQPGSRKCLRCLLNKVSPQTERLIASRHARGVWCCTGCYYAEAPSEGKLCVKCRDKGAVQRALRKRKAQEQADAAAEEARIEAHQSAYLSQVHALPPGQIHGGYGQVHQLSGRAYPSGAVVGSSLHALFGAPGYGQVSQDLRPGQPSGGPTQTTASQQEYHHLNGQDDQPYGTVQQGSLLVAQSNLASDQNHIGYGQSYGSQAGAGAAQTQQPEPYHYESYF
ncbi:hypothetical protein B0T20DRAFT_478788 [Sordaria brevicollis]|uniref:Uncharacterized protein n=1 Tax=Sordaria brevicollis TaxID=83679 RepID=A0AAE0PH58_SORBR|nr:hypothetical protein B0T20DRAFT_478788 [Sordaria brevicollis]